MAEKKERPNSEVLKFDSKKDVNKLVVQKSIPLLSLWKSPITLSEFKILDMYLAKIDSRKPEYRAVVFKKKDLENVIGVGRIREEELKKRLHNLMNIIEVEDINNPNRKAEIVLFDYAEYEKNEDGVKEILLECSEKASKYFFNIENVGYLRYKLRCISNIGSRYSYVMFCYLEKNRFRGTWEVGVDELKEILNCTSESYNNYKLFNDKVLKMVHKELQGKTECKYDYEGVKDGRKVIKIKFTLKSNGQLIPEREELENVEYIDCGDADE